MRKKVLWVGEASYLSTGYAVYAKEVLSRLHSTGKYEIAELAAYGTVGDERASSIPWRFYPNMPASQEEAQAYNSNAANQFGKFRFEEVCCHWKPDVVCVPPGQLVLTEEGYKPIEEIKVGERVLTHNRTFKPVITKMRRQHDGKLYTIHYNGCKEPLVVTGNHPVLVYKYKRQTNQKKSYAKIYNGVHPEFVCADQVKKKDLVVLPYIVANNNIQYHTIDITDYLSKFIEKDGVIYPQQATSRSNKIPKNIILDEDFARLIGYIIADGHISKLHINIMFGGNEEEFVLDVENIVNKIFGIKSTITKCKDRFAITINFHSVIIAKFLKKFIGGHRVPKELLLSRKSVIENFICGIIRGDGNYSKNTVTLCTVDKKLAHIFRFMCACVDIPTNISITKRGKFPDAYTISGYGESATKLHNIVHKKEKVVGLSENPIRRSRCTHIINNHLVSAVKRIRTSDYLGQVYNLEVEDDHSYIVQQTCVHNCDIRDSWMASFIINSPLRNNYRFIHMPTVDSESQHEDWLYDYMQCDALLAYSEFGKRTLEEESGGKLRVLDIASPAANPEVFKPLDKVAIRKHLGLPEDILIVGTVMRNQRRKLYPELIQAFRQFLSKAPTELAKRSFLYFHTAFPDLGWDMPRLIRESGISHKIYFTYVCTRCKHIFVAHFQDARMVCPHCGSPTGVTPNVQNGVSSEQLAQIYNTFDVYAQYSISEGFGIGQVEAGHCAVPVMMTDYSAMESVCKNIRGIPIRVDRYFREPDSHMYRVFPDNTDFVEKLTKLLSLPASLRSKKGFETMVAARAAYSYDKAAAAWEKVIDNIPVDDSWSKAAMLHQPRIPDENLQVSQADFVNLCLVHILGKPELVNTHFAAKLIKDLTFGYTTTLGAPNINEMAAVGQQRPQEFHRKKLIQHLVDLARENLYWEQRRTGMINVPPSAAILYCKEENK